MACDTRRQFARGLQVGDANFKTLQRRFEKMCHESRPNEVVADARLQAKLKECSEALVPAFQKVQQLCLQPLKAFGPSPTWSHGWLKGSPVLNEGRNHSSPCAKIVAKRGSTDQGTGRKLIETGEL